VRNLFMYCCKYTKKPDLVRKITQFNNRPLDLESVRTFVDFFRANDDLWEVIRTWAGETGDEIKVRYGYVYECFPLLRTCHLWTSYTNLSFTKAVR
jgi:hypothetical protein